MGHKKTSDSQYNPEQEQCRRDHHSDLKINYRSVVIKIRCWPKNRHLGPWNKFEDPNINAYDFSHLVFHKDAKHMLEKRKHLQKMVLGKLDVYMQKKENISASITLHRTINK